MNFKSYFVYGIKSNRDGRIYVGLTMDVDRRIKEHNLGQVFSTQYYKPWKLIYKEKVGSLAKARQRERYFKSGCGKEILKNIRE